MRWPHFLTMIATGLLAACASPPIDQGQPASVTVVDPRASYKRSKPEAPTKAIPFQEFGFLDGQQLRLTLNDTLAGQQVYEHCDQKPVDVSPAWQMPRCKLMGDSGCRVFEAVPGQKVPACKMTNFFGTCLLSETPQPPPKQFGVTNDCYKVQAGPDVLGRIGVYAVPEGTPRSETVSRGRRVAAVALQKGGSQTVTIPPQAVASNECFALVDTRGNVIGLRGQDTSPGSHLFATPQMMADRKMRDLQKAANQDQEIILLWQQDVAKDTRALQANPAWDGKRCVEPAVERLPPDYKGMSSGEIEFQAKGYCAALLGTLIGSNEVLNAAAALQEFDYRAAAFRLGLEPIHAPVCTHKSHQFSDADIKRLNSEWGRAAPSAPGGRNEMILGLLRQCTASAVDICGEPKRQWDLEVKRIREAPELALKSCETALRSLKTSTSALQLAESEAAQSKLPPSPTPAPTKPERVRVALSAATCGKVLSK